MGETHRVHDDLTQAVHGVSMTNYRRFRQKGGTFFFTVKLQDRGAGLLVERAWLRI